MHLAPAVGRLLGRLVRLLTLLVLLAGVPAGLVTQVPWPGRAETIRALTHPASFGHLALAASFTNRTAIVLLAAVLAVLWTAFTVSVAVELGALVRGVPVPRLPGLSPLQTAAGWLVAGLTAAILATSTASALPPHPSTATVSVEPSAQVDTGNAGTTDRSVPPKAVVPVGAATPATGVTAVADEADLERPRFAVSVADQQPLVVATRGQHYTVTVHRGDTLWDIAATWLHDPTRWPEIYRLNTARYDQNGRMLGGDHIEPGWVLQLPDDAVPPQDARPTAPPGTPSTPPAQTPAPPRSPATPSPMPSTSTPTPSPSGSQTRPTPPSSARSPRTDRGISLPGGWVPIGLAAALLAAASLVWLHRRHRYRPRLLDAPGEPDTKPTALPPTIRRLRRGVRNEDQPSTVRPAVPDAAAGEEPVDHATVPGSPDGHRHPILEPIGPDGPTLAGLPAPIPATCLGITGPGAHAAARALLVATLSTGSPDDPDARGHVVVPTTVLATLLGVDAVHVPSLPRLHVTADLPAALTHLDGLLLYRRRLLEEDGAIDLAELREHNPYHEPMPPTLLIAEAPADTVRARLDTTLTLGEPLQVSAVLLGESASAAAVVVDAQGHTDSHPLAVLDTSSTLDLLAVLAEAHTGEAPIEDPAEPSSSTSPGLLSSSGSVDAAVAEDVDRPSGPSAPPDTARPVPVRVLGPPAILTVDDDVVPGLRGKAREMLVYLALHRSGANLPDIQEALWPDATVRRAGERLATEVGNLRGRIREAAGDANVQPVINTGGRYHLNPELLDIDWWRLQDTQSAATTTTEPAQQLALLRQALEALHGPLAEGCDYDWIPEHLEHARRVAIELHAQLADLLTTTAPEEAAHLIEVATAIDPYNEQLACQAMTIHAQLDQPEAIRNDLRRLRVALTDIDVEPEADTVALATKLLHQPVGAPKAAPR